MNKQTRISFRPAFKVASGLGALALVGSANAAIDTTAALAGVTDASTAVVAVIGGMILMAAAIFGLKKVYGLLGSK